MKKHISLLLILCLLFSMAPISMSVSAATVNSEEVVNRVFGLGLMPHANQFEYIPDAPVSRGEIAWVLDNIYSYEETTANTDFTWQFWGNADLETGVLKEAPPLAVARFEDVPVSHWAYTIIEDVINYGLMRGVSDTQFMPDENMTIEQLAKTMVVLLGYEAKAEAYGGYPTGYMTVASELKLLRGVNAGEYITNADLIQVLDNCLDVDLMDYEGIIRSGNGLYSLYVSSDDTFLTGILGVSKIEGIMTDNSITTLLGASQVREGEFVIGGVKLKAETDMFTTLLELIARDIECYYVSAEGNKKLDYIIYSALTGKDNTITIAANDFLGYDDGTFSYYVNDRVKKEKVSDFYNVIYNGRAMSIFDETIFDITDGFITIVDAADTDIVIIEDYESWFVSAVDYDEQRVYNALSSTGDDHTFVFEDYDHVNIYKADGTIGDIVDIVPNTVINISRHMNAASIWICDALDVIKLASTSTLNGETYLEGDGKKYAISNRYANFSNRIDYKIGDELTLYMNKFGKIAWMVLGNAKDYKAGYMYNSMLAEGLLDRVGIQVFDSTEKKSMDFFTSPDKIKVSNSVGVESNMTVAEFWENYGNYRGVIRYMINQDNILTYFEVPITDVRNAKDNKLTLVFSNTGASDSQVRFRYNNMGGKAIFNTSSIAFSVDRRENENPTGPKYLYSEDSFVVQPATSTFVNEKDYNVECYALNKDSKLANFAVIYEASKITPVVFGSTTKLQMMVVKKVLDIYDEDEGGLTAIQGYAFNKSNSGSPNKDIELVVDKSILSGGKPVIKSILGNDLPENTKLEAGDIIVFGTNEDGYASEIRLLFDENGKYAYNPNGADGALTDSKGYYGVKRAEGDTTVDVEEEPFWNNSNRLVTDVSKSSTNYLRTNLPNPLNISTTSPTDYAMTSSGFSSGPFNVYHGYVSRIKDGAIEMTTQDLTIEEFDPLGCDRKHFTRVWTIPTNVLVINLSGKDSVQTTWGTYSSLNPIRTNEIYKHDCSRVITFSAYAELSRMIVINGNLNN